MPLNVEGVTSSATGVKHMRIGKETTPQMGRSASGPARDIHSARVIAVVNQASIGITETVTLETTNPRTSKSSAICVMAANTAAHARQSPLANRGRASHQNRRGGA